MTCFFDVLAQRSPAVFTLKYSPIVYVVHEIAYIEQCASVQ